jgi:DNA (cytosine-5)-methyltransferase 1
LNLEINWPPSPTHFSPKSDEVKEKGKWSWLPASMVFKKAITKGDPNNIHMNHSKELLEVFESTPKNGGSRAQSKRQLPCHKNHDGHKDVYGRIDPARPGPTITTGCVNPSKGRFLHPTKNHGITVRHAARFQTFSDDFTFNGGLMASAIQVGNAVPIKLGKKVIISVYDALSVESLPQHTLLKGC